MSETEERRNLRAIPSLFLPLITLLLLFVPLSSPVSAFLLSPATTPITAEPGATYSFTLTVTNDQATPLLFNITADGALSSSLAIDPSSFGLAPGESRQVSVILSAPADLSPGRIDGRILVAASPPSSSQFGGAVTLVSTVRAYHAYAGAYIEATLRLPETAEPGAPVSILVSLANRGEAPAIVSSSARISDPSGSGIGDADLGSAELPGAGKGKLSAVWDAPSEPGRYLVAATLSYEDPLAGERGLREEGSIRVGSPRATIAPWSGAIVAGRIAAVETPVAIAWNEPVEATLSTTLAVGERRIEATSLPAELLPGEEAPMRLYLEIPEGLEGEGELSLEMRDGSGLLLGELSLPVTVTAPAGGLPSTTERSPLPMLLGLLLLSLLLLSLLLLFLRRRAKKGRPTPAPGKEDISGDGSAGMMSGTEEGSASAMTETERVPEDADDALQTDDGETAVTISR